MNAALLKYSNSIMTVIMLAIFVTMVGTAVHYPYGARLMPFFVGIPGIALCLLQLALDARERSRPAGESKADVSPFAGRSPEFGASEPALSQQQTIRRELVIWGYFLGFIGGILAAGFWIAIPIYLVVYLRLQAKLPWPKALTFGLGGTAVFYMIFEWALRAQLHAGFIAEYFGG